MTSRIDVRWPIGLLWIAIGLLLASYGVIAQHPVGHSLAVDRLWGCAMLVFGIVMLATAAAGAAGAIAPERVEAQKVESRPHQKP